MSRSRWKGFNCGYNSYKKLIKQFNVKSNCLSRKTFGRDCPIPSFIVSKKMNTYNGKIFKSTRMVFDQIGYKFGHFCSTRKYSLKKLDKKLNLKKKNKK